MALNRWLVAATVVVGLATWFARDRSRTQPGYGRLYGERSPQEFARDSVRRALRDLEQRAQVWSAAAAVASTPLPADTASVVILNPPFDSLRRRALSFVDSALRDAAFTAPRIVVAILDSGESRPEFGWQPTSFTVLPAGTADGRCVAVVEGRAMNWGLRQALAPCLYLRHFGAPGTRIAHWLDRIGWLPAQSADWEPGETRMWRQYTGLPFRRVNTHPSFGAVGHEPTLGYKLGMVFGILGLSPAYFEGAVTARCLSRAADACAEWALDTVAAGVLRRQWPAHVSGMSHRGSVDWPFDASDPPPGGLLGELVATFGKERFAAFWRSDDDVERAFHAAFGQPLGVWLANQWPSEDWRTTRYVWARPTIGVRAPLRTTALALLWAASAIALVAWRWRRSPA